LIQNGSEGNVKSLLVESAQVFQKLEQLPPERIAEVAAFVDFLAQRELEKRE
jgi:hypothetical protein